MSNSSDLFPAPSPASSTITSSLSSSPASSSPTASTSGSTSTESTVPASSTVVPSTISQGPQSSTPVSPKPPCGSHISSGAIAGISIACTVLGACFAFLLIMCLRRTQSKSSSRHRKGRSYHLQKSSRAENTTKEAPPTSTNSTAKNPHSHPTIDLFLPQQADDDAVRQRILTLFDQIEQHVDNFYGQYAEKVSAEQEGELSRYSTPILTEPLAALLERSYRKTAVIKHCLGFYAITSISSMLGSESLMPKDVSAAYAMIQSDRGQSEQVRKDRNYYLALSRWRMLAAYLRPDLFDGSATSSADWDQRAYELASKFSHAFGPFSQPQYDEHRVKHLAEVLRTAVRLTLWLQTQPSTFRFDWGPTSERSEKSSETVVIIPVVLKTHDEYGADVKPVLVIQPLVRKRVTKQGTLQY